jgi:hypothetical protein
MARTNARANAASGGRADEAPSATERVRAELLMLRRDRDALRGECAELREQLKQQRERTEHLARDLGRAEALTAVPARLGLVDRLAGWLRRRDGADNRVGKNVGAALRAEPSGAVVGRSDAIVPFVTQRRAPRVLMAVMIGLDAEALERALMPIRESSGDGETEMETLCLTDCGRFELFRRHRLLFEYFPPPPAAGALRIQPRLESLHASPACAPAAQVEPGAHRGVRADRAGADPVVACIALRGRPHQGSDPGTGCGHRRN